LDSFERVESSFHHVPPKNRNKSGSKKKKSTVVIRSLLPPIDMSPVYTRTIRYVSLNNEGKGADTISSTALQGLMYVGLGSNTGKSMFAAVRLRRVDIYGTPTTTFDTIALEWSSDRGSDRTVSATGGASGIARISCRPPKGSFAEMWYNRWNSQYNPALFTVSCGAGTLMDITFNFTLLDSDGQSQGSTLTAPTTSAGLIYYNYADSSAVYGVSGSPAAGTNNWQPVAISQYLTGYF
jgi:hypothetical protein